MTAAFRTSRFTFRLGFAFSVTAAMAAAALLAATLLFSAATAQADDAKADAPKAGGKASAERCFEMRTYIAADGKMADLHKRFREHTNRLFQKHGMQLIGYWTPTEGPEAANTLVYILAYPSREAREKSWKGFMADPEWQAVYKESHKNGPLVAKVIAQFLQPTDYSPIK